MVSSTLGGAALGSLTGGGFAEALGRRAAFMVCAVPMLIGPLLSANATSLNLMVAGRFLSGIAIGLSSALVPLYISEVSAWLPPPGLDFTIFVPKAQSQRAVFSHNSLPRMAVSGSSCCMVVPVFLPCNALPSCLPTDDYDKGGGLLMVQLSAAILLISCFFVPDTWVLKCQESPYPCSTVNSRCMPIIRPFFLHLLQVSPTKIRGTLGSLNQLMICVGILVALLANVAIPATDWRTMFNLAVIPAAALLLGEHWLGAVGLVVLCTRVCRWQQCHYTVLCRGLMVCSCRTIVPSSN